MLSRLVPSARLYEAFDRLPVSAHPETETLRLGNVENDMTIKKA
jgi:hypothetical protein